MNDQDNHGANRGKASAKRQIGENNADCQQDFTAGLKQLYDSIVDDPIPPHLMALLAKFDEADDLEEMAKPGIKPISQVDPKSDITEGK